MWLRSERISRRLRGRLNLSGITTSKATGHRTQVGTSRKVPHIGNNSRVITSSRCGKLNQWRRRSSSFLKEVSCSKRNKNKVETIYKSNTNFTCISSFYVFIYILKSGNH